MSSFKIRPSYLDPCQLSEVLHISYGGWLLYFLDLSLMFWMMKFFQYYNIKLVKHFLGSCA